MIDAPVARVLEREGYESGTGELMHQISHVAAIGSEAMDEDHSIACNEVVMSRPRAVRVAQDGIACSH
ncbi:hypothetical protein [Mitsuaria sp. 7]|uniref:hypothetical protein n=1 Tax=Mitsuaria sp. 7 TaxID=1658665 RepID=UPI001E37352F|nr:hypothetical protein [Mitsuaria sp. 7]